MTEPKTTRRGLLGLAAFAFGGRYVRRLENNVPTFATDGVLRDYHIGDFIGEKTTESVLTQRQVQTLRLNVDATALRGAVEFQAAKIKDAVDVPNRLAGTRINSEGEAV